jgi:hypothetical protein
VWCGVQFAETKINALAAVDIVDAGECCESSISGAMLDEFTTYQVEGSIVDYLASDG